MIKQETLKKQPIPTHIAFILDGNGRWAKRLGRTRAYGHMRGAMNVRTIAKEAKSLGVEVMSVYAFSTENWKRPQKEIDTLMDIPKRFEKEYESDNEEFKQKYFADEVRIVFTGRRDRLDTYNLGLMKKVEDATKDNEGLILNICVDYGAKDELIHVAKTVAKKVKQNTLSLDSIDESTLEKHLYTHPLPPVDFLIRTSGEQRLSNYLLWQNAYAEFLFTKKHWPAFSKSDLRRAIRNYQKRNRKFGGLKKG